MKYELITSSFDFELDKVVNARLAEGWTLYGFPFGVSQPLDENGNDQSLLCQAMILKENDESDFIGVLPQVGDAR